MDRPASEKRPLTLDERKEDIIKSYRESFDLDASYRINHVSRAERARLEQDEEFQGRLEYFLTIEKTRLYESLREMMTGDVKDETRLKAIIKLGEILYPEKFIEGYDKKTGKKDLGTLNLKICFEE